MEHYAVLQTLPEGFPDELPQAPPKRTSQCRHEAFTYLPRTVNVTRGAASRTDQVPHLNGPTSINKDTSEDILADAEVLVTPHRWV